MQFSEEFSQSKKGKPQGPTNDPMAYALVKRALLISLIISSLNEGYNFSKDSIISGITGINTKTFPIPSNASDKNGKYIESGNPKKIFNLQ